MQTGLVLYLAATFGASILVVLFGIGRAIRSSGRRKNPSRPDRLTI